MILTCPISRVIGKVESSTHLGVCAQMIANT